MNGSALDSVTQIARGGNSRRIALKTALGGAVASAVAAVGLAASASNAEAKKKKKKCKKCKGKELGESCTTNEQCCTNETNRLCAFSFTSPNDLICCGGEGAKCVTADDCCGDGNISCDEGVCGS